jgi:hypothetical protein
MRDGRSDATVGLQSGPAIARCADILACNLLLGRGWPPAQPSPPLL